LGFDAGCGLFVVTTQNPARWSVDEVLPGAGDTGYGLIDLAFMLRRVIGEPTLHVQARCGTAIDESCHVTI
jgi:hypothetical protein